jgi:cytochrome c
LIALSRAHDDEAASRVRSRRSYDSPATPDLMPTTSRIRRLPSPFVIAAGLWLFTHTLAAQAQMAPADIARKSGCMSCHGLVHKQVGPGFAQIADRYRNDVDAPAHLADKIQSGSVGTWGRVIMPRQTQVTDAEAQALARWVLSQPSPPR